MTVPSSEVCDRIDAIVDKIDEIKGRLLTLKGEHESGGSVSTPNYGTEHSEIAELQAFYVWYRENVV